MLACNAMPGVFCGLVIDPTDAFLFAQINDGNAVAMPYAKGFGWAAELNLQDCYRKLFESESGVGYPRERAAVMAENRGVLARLKEASCKDMLTVLKSVDQDLLKTAIAGERFEEHFYPASQGRGRSAPISRACKGLNPRGRLGCPRTSPDRIAALPRQAPTGADMQPGGEYTERTTR